MVVGGFDFHGPPFRFKHFAASRPGHTRRVHSESGHHWVGFQQTSKSSP
jgi:hypothetical protein